jgi:poly-gamma-glutamate system protein
MADMIRAELRSRARFIVLAAVMVCLWALASQSTPSREEQALWEQVRAAQLHLSSWRENRGIAASRDDDPFGCGLIGREWSVLTTTLGSLEAKRTACDPAWAVRFTRWYREAGLQAGDTVAIYSSASFPALLLSSQAAAESLGLDTLIIVSLGASTWGANHPDAPWPVLAKELRRGGFLVKQADYYTLGGGSEIGGGLATEALELMEQSAHSAGVELLRTNDLQSMIDAKSGLLLSRGAKLLVSIGGSQANLGDDPEVLELQPGMLAPGLEASAGNGVIARALDAGLPVLHLLNIRELAMREGISLDSAPGRVAPVAVSPWWSIVGLLLFFTVVLTHRRWRLL